MERYFSPRFGKPVVVNRRGYSRVNGANYVIEYHETEEKLSLLKLVVH